MESGSAAPLQIHAGDSFAGKYRVERVLGRGGMSVVVAAWHPGLGQRVALKLLATPTELAPEAVSRFFREARAAAALRSEHSARVVDVDVDEMGRHYIVMEYLEGLDLADFYRQVDVLPIETCVGHVLHACEAIAEAHALGIIHRDLKPENLFLTQRVDGTPLLKVLDFGVSKLIHPGVRASDAGTSTADTLLGTPNYMSPDQIRTPGDIDGRSDIWALGVILFELLTRRAPFRGDTVPDVLAAVLTSDPPSPSALRADIPAELSAIILRCIQKDASQRWSNVGMLAQALGPWCPPWALEAAHRAARISGVTDSGAGTSATARARSGRLAAGAGAAALLAALLVAGRAAAPRASASAAPRQEVAVRTLVTEGSSPGPDADLPGENRLPLLAALDVPAQGARRPLPDAEAAESAASRRLPLASPQARPAPGAAPVHVAVTPPAERRRKPMPDAKLVDPLSSRR